MAFYDNMAATATNLIRKFGQEVILSRIIGETFDGPSGEYTGGTATDWTGFGARFEYSSYNIDVVNILSTDIKLLLELVAEIPKIGDTVEVDSRKYEVINVKSIAPATSVVYYELQLRV